MKRTKYLYITNPNNIKGLRPSGRPIAKPTNSWKRLRIEQYRHIAKSDLAGFARWTANRPTSRAILEHLQRKDLPQVQFVANAHLDAIDFAVHVVDPKISASRLVVFCDGSLAQGNGGFGIAYTSIQDQASRVDWVDACYGVHFNRPVSTLMEIIAIHRTLWIVYEEMTRLADAKALSLPKTIILSDCLPAINYFNSLYHKTLPCQRGLAETLTDNALVPLRRMERLGCKVEIHWVPGHVGIARNERADALAAYGGIYASRVPRATGTSFKEIILPLSATKEFKHIDPIDIGKPWIEASHWHTAEMHNITCDLLKMEQSETLSEVKVVSN